MKKAIMPVMFLLLTLTAPAKEIKGLIGINWNKYLFSEEIDAINRQSKSGVTIGLGWLFALNPKMQVEIETLFSEKGAKAELVYAPGNSIPAIYKNKSIGIPVLFKYKLKEGASPYMLLGPEFNFILAHKLVIPEYDRSLNIADNTNKFILAINIALGYELPLGQWGLFVEARYNRWLSDLWQSPDASVKSESISFLLGSIYCL